MKHRTKILSLAVLSLLIGLSSSFYAQSDSVKVSKTKKTKVPKHFFHHTIFLDYYYKPPAPLLKGSGRLDTGRIAKHLGGDYGVAQSNISFYSPLLTIDKYNRDSTVNYNFHLLLSGTAYYLQPIFSGISQHTLAKYGLGIRAIYNTGKKSIFFIESSPFLTQDITPGSSDPGTWRMSGTLLWSFSPGEKFNLRIGATKSFLWGNRVYLPFIGLRFGRLDRLNFSIQFPKNISLNLPIGNSFRLSLYSKPQGGVFNFSNRDTVYNGSYYKNTNISDEKVIHFGRYELLTGFRMDVVPCTWINFYLSTGFSTKNGIAFYSNNFNKNKKGQYGNFYAASPKNSVFINAGVTFRIGRTKSYYGNQNLYEVIDLNNSIDPGDNNVNPGNGTIPTYKKAAIKSLKPSEIQDLIDMNDF